MICYRAARVSKWFSFFGVSTESIL